VQVGWYRTTTRERVTLDPNRRRLVFEQLHPRFSPCGRRGKPSSWRRLRRARPRSP
jgi:hypothetical protein